MTNPYIIPGVQPTENVERIISRVTSYYHVTLEQIQSDSRDETINFPRQILAYLLEKSGMKRWNTSMLISRDRSTIIHCNKTIKNAMDTGIKLFPQPDGIIELIEEHYGIPFSQIQGNSHKYDIVKPRHVLIWLLMKAGMTLPQVMAYLNMKRNRIRYSLSAIKSRMKVDEQFRNELEYLKRQIKYVKI